MLFDFVFNVFFAFFVVFGVQMTYYILLYNPQATKVRKTRKRRKTRRRKRKRTRRLERKRERTKIRDASLQKSQ
jgi:predicted membrane protein